MIIPNYAKKHFESKETNDKKAEICKKYYINKYEIDKNNESISIVEDLETQLAIERVFK